HWLKRRGRPTGPPPSLYRRLAGAVLPHYVSRRRLMRREAIVPSEPITPAAPRAAAIAAQAGTLPPTGDRLPTPLAGPPAPPAAPPPADPRPAAVPPPAAAPPAAPPSALPPTSCAVVPGGGSSVRHGLVAAVVGPPTVIVESLTQRISAPSGEPAFGSQASPMPSPTSSPAAFLSWSPWLSASFLPFATTGQLS